MTEFIGESGPEGNESVQIAEILRGYGEEHGFDSETCDEVAAMSFPDAYETSYRYLVSAGLDADDILASFTEEPPEIYLM